MWNRFFSSLLIILMLSDESYVWQPNHKSEHATPRWLQPTTRLSCRSLRLPCRVSQWCRVNECLTWRAKWAVGGGGELRVRRRDSSRRYFLSPSGFRWREETSHPGRTGRHNSPPALCLINKLLQISPIRLAEEILGEVLGCWQN